MICVPNRQTESEHQFKTVGILSQSENQMQYNQSVSDLACNRTGAAFRNQ